MERWCSVVRTPVFNCVIPVYLLGVATLRLDRVVMEVLRTLFLIVDKLGAN